ncbi:hypothetical protein CDN98_06760 [Roseateles terrae]|nr:hypothetical protein CDN98_06760 [Roseateles terrae]
MKRETIEIGARTVVRSRYRGFQVDVITGYDTARDRYPVHIEVTGAGPDSRSIKLLRVATEFTIYDAIDAGFAAAERAIDAAEFNNI